MKTIGKQDPFRKDRRAQPRREYGWQVGNATVSTDELQAWQLGPENFTVRLGPGAERRASSRSGEPFRDVRG
jgi:hypothetical protein